MIHLDALIQRFGNTVLKLAICAAVLMLSLFFGFRPSPRWLGLLVVGLGAVLLVQKPPLGLVALTLAALVVPTEIRTGTAISLNIAALLVPAMLGIWVLDMAHRQDLRMVTSRANLPLLLFLLANLFSLLIGIVFWDLSVPRSDDFLLVQLAQWAIFVFSAGAFWLTGNLLHDEVWLRRLTFIYLGVFGVVVILFTYPQLLFTSATISMRVNRMTTFALHRAPFWLLLTAVAGGQLLFNRKLSNGWRIFLLATLGGILIYVFDLMRKTASNWVGVVAVAGVLGWLRWPRLRWPVIALFVVLAGTGLLSSTIYDFAGGDDEWESSGGSRLVLINRVIEVTLHNPVTGLGPAAYRLYAPMKPLIYEGAFWDVPVISSHNNYVDLFSHAGVIGLGLFLWFAAELAKVGLRLRDRFKDGFAAGYINAMLATGAGALTLMLFADWILPFVYNVGFSGFQASVLVWLFMGGLLTFEQIANSESAG